MVVAIVVVMLVVFCFLLWWVSGGSGYTCYTTGCTTVMKDILRHQLGGKTAMKSIGLNINQQTAQEAIIRVPKSLFKHDPSSYHGRNQLAPASCNVL